jgi:hypothetical protein
MIKFRGRKFKTLKLLQKYLWSLSIPIRLKDIELPKRLQNKLDYQHGFTKRDRKNIFKLPVKDLPSLKGKTTPKATDSRSIRLQPTSICCTSKRMKDGKEVDSWIHAKFQGIRKKNGKRYKTYKCPNCLQWIMVEIQPKMKKEVI